MSRTAVRSNIPSLITVAPASVAKFTIGDPLPPDHDEVLDIALEALRFEHAHAEASRSRAAGLLTACGVLLALTADWDPPRRRPRRDSPISAPRSPCARPR
jgi:hypothetical protein